ncbi:MAG: VWA domain-containing protein [Planctomycetota bacterium]|jgi:hypothetical protein|nr:VWA domain-containing protein [Planctomycetota bacterium]MDP6763050.1 VWA domain-containing protein [Planctomycetota bacterium]
MLATAAGILALAVAAPQGSADAAALREFDLAFRATRDPAANQERREAALAALAGQDTREAARSLLDAFVQLESEAAPLEAERLGYLENGRRNKQLEVRPGLDPLRSLQESVRAHLLALRDPVATHFLLEQALERRRLPFSLRSALPALAAHAGPKADDLLARALRRRHEPGVMCVLLRTAGALGPRGRSADDLAIGLLSHEHAVLREQAAEALARTASPAAIAPLVRRLGEESGRTRTRMGRSLEILTRRPLGTSPSVWQRWFEEEGAAYAAGDVALGGGEPSESSAVADQAVYHGIPIEGESTLFLFDRSLSMQAPLYQGEDAPEEANPSRFARAKEELSAVLGRLSPSRRFGVIAFGGTLDPFSPEVLPATEENVALAREWIGGLTMNLGTRTYDVLDFAFAVAGGGALDRYHDSTVDTLFVLTDGLPIRGGKADSVKRIHAAVRRWNLFGRVVVHVICLGDKAPTKFAKGLAEQNGGRYVREPRKD